ncbi:MAG: hypothetical protein IPM85_10120 [Chitinophagaceae bacterium]|nr:hypothetical protein [Chitinophagaceae bacterium]
MKKKFILVIFSICGYLVANAGTELYFEPGEGKKDELNGTIVHAETKNLWKV